MPIGRRKPSYASPWYRSYHKSCQHEKLNPSMNGRLSAVGTTRLDSASPAGSLHFINIFHAFSLDLPHFETLRLPRAKQSKTLVPEIAMKAISQIVGAVAAALMMQGTCRFIADYPNTDRLCSRSQCQGVHESGREFGYCFKSG